MKSNEIKYLILESGEKYPYIYSLNVMSAIQKKYKSIDNWSRLVEPKKGKEPNIDAVLFFYKEAINDAIDMENEKLAVKKEYVDIKKVGRIVTQLGLQNAGNKLKAAVVDASGINNLNEENNSNEKNQLTTQNQ